MPFLVLACFQYRLWCCYLWFYIGGIYLVALLACVFLFFLVFTGAFANWFYLPRYPGNSFSQTVVKNVTCCILMFWLSSKNDSLTCYCRRISCLSILMYCGCKSNHSIALLTSCPSTVLINTWIGYLYKQFLCALGTVPMCFAILIAYIACISSITAPFFLKASFGLTLHVLRFPKVAISLLSVQSNQYVFIKLLSYGSLFLLFKFQAHISTSFLEYLKLNLTLIY